jgi:hypothetical protein
MTTRMAGATHEERIRELERRLHEFHGVGSAQVLELVAYLREPGDSVVAGGSLTFGLGNRLSDYDVVICGADTASSKVPLEHWVGSLRVDLWTRSHADIARLFEQATAALAGPAPLRGAFGGVEEEQQLKLLHRIAFGLLLDGPPLDAAAGTDCARVARDLVVREYAERMRSSAAVAQLAAGAGAWLAATVNARTAVEEALHVVLTARGVPFSGDKWLADRLATGDRELAARWQRFERLPVDAAAAAFVTGAVALGTELTGLPLDLDALLPAATWVGRGALPHRLGTESLLVAPASGALVRLSDDEAAAWRGLAAAAVGADGGRWAAARLDAAGSDLCLRLYEQGLVDLAWDRGVALTDLTLSKGVPA